MHDLPAGPMMRRSRVAVATRSPGRIVPKRAVLRYYAVAAAIGVVANTALASPLCPASTRMLSAWSMACIMLMAFASMVAAASLRSIVRGRSKASLWVAGVLHPLLSAVVFAPLMVWVSGLLRGQGEPFLASLLYTIYGPIMFGLTAHVSVPLGILGVWAMRAVW